MFNNKNKQYIIFKEDIHQWKIKDNIYSYELRSFFKKKGLFILYKGHFTYFESNPIIKYKLQKELR